MRKNTDGRDFPIYDLDLIEDIYTTIVWDHMEIEKHGHTFWELAITLQGSYVNYFTQGRLECPINSVVVIRPHDVHQIFTMNALYRDIYVLDEEMRRLCDMISPTLYDELNEARMPPHVILDQNTINSINAVAQLLVHTQLNNAENKERYFALRNTLIMKAFCGYCEQVEIEKLGVESSVVPAWLLELVAKLNVGKSMVVNRSTLPTLTEILEGTGYSRGHSCREFKKYYNCTIMQYWNKQRLLYSTKLLLNANISILEIAQILRYSNQASYVNSFKKMFQCPPSVWRKTHIKRQ